MRCRVNLRQQMRAVWSLTRGGPVRPSSRICRCRYVLWMYLSIIYSDLRVRTPRRTLASIRGHHRCQSHASSLSQGVGDSRIHRSPYRSLQVALLSNTHGIFVFSPASSLASVPPLWR